MTDKARELLEWIVKETELMPDKFHISDMLDNEIRAYLSAPRPEFVRLSEEEIVSWWGVATEAGLIEFARAIEDALEEKNQ